MLIETILLYFVSTIHMDVTMLAKKRLLLSLLLVISFTNAFAGLMPYEWDEANESIYQLTFEGQYDDQSIT